MLSDKWKWHSKLRVRLASVALGWFYKCKILMHLLFKIYLETNERKKALQQTSKWISKIRI